MKKKNGEEMAGPTFPEVGEGVQKEKLRRKMKKVGLNVVENMNTVNERNNKQLQEELKKLLVGKKDGGLMEAIKRVDAEKEKRLKDGGMIGNLTSNFKGNY
jgi:hypothetical protein